MKRRYFIAAALAFAMVLGLSVAPASAYFTDYSTANGGMPIAVEPEPEMHEWYAERTKEIVITNAEDATMPIYTRVRVYTSLEYEVTGTGWTLDENGEWYVYDGTIAPGEQSSKLKVNLTFPKIQVEGEAQPDASVYGDEYNVEVLYDYAPVQYDAKGNAYCDWNYDWNTGN